MKVLQICLRVPYPPADGGTIAMYNLALGLNSAGAEVKVLALNTKKHFIDPASLPGEFVQTFRPEMVYLDASVKPLPAFFNLFGSGSYNITRFDSELFHTELRKILTDEEFDVIQLESLFVTPYISTIRKYSKGKIILRAHNMEHVIWERLAATESNVLRKTYLNFLVRRLKKYELSVFDKLDGVVVLTREDLELFRNNGCKVPLLVAPIGVDIEKYAAYRGNEVNGLVFHLGSMDWLPNIEGVEWFLNYVLPLVRQKNPDIKIYLAGKSMPEKWMQMNDPLLTISGRVDEAKQFMSDKSIMIVPLLSGGGMRVKIIEGLALGKTIISTTIGAEGIQYTNQLNMLIADEPESFAQAIEKCINDPEFCREIGLNAALLADEMYDNLVIGKKVLGFYSEMSTGKKLTSEYQEDFKTEGQK